MPMKQVAHSLLLTAMLTLSTSAVFAKPASEISVRELMTVTQMPQLVKNMSGQIESKLDAAIQQSLRGRVPTPKEQQAIDKMLARTKAMINKELSWDRLEPRYVQLYTETLSEEEVRGMLDFYKTPAGQAVIQKLPSLTQKALGMFQSELATLRPEQEQIMRDFGADMKAARQ